MAKYKPRRALPPDDEPAPPVHRPTPEPPPVPEPPVTDRAPDPAPDQSSSVDTADTVVSAPVVEPAPSADRPTGFPPAPAPDPMTDTSTRILRVPRMHDLDEEYEPKPRPKVDRKSQRVWRAGRATMTVVTIATVLTVAALGVLAYLLYQDERPIILVAGLAVLAVALLIYCWRLAWHPRLVSAGTQLIVRNPMRTRTFDWSAVTLILPGPNGMIIGTDQEQVEAWCIQKGRSALKRGHRTRADRIAEELWDLWDAVDPPMADDERDLRIRRARPNEVQLLTRLERAANEHALGHIFPPKRFPYPTTDVARRWQTTLAERQVRVRILEVGDGPVAFIAYDHQTVRHLGVLPQHSRKGYGSTLLTFAEEDVFSAGSGQVQLWVLTENRAARAFYRSHGWIETEDRRRSEFPPKPDELRMIKINKRAQRGPAE